LLFLLLMALGLGGGGGFDYPSCNLGLFDTEQLFVGGDGR
jgi:hypothetical protein